GEGARAACPARALREDGEPGRTRGRGPRPDDNGESRGQRAAASTHRGPPDHERVRGPAPPREKAFPQRREGRRGTRPARPDDATQPGRAGSTRKNAPPGPDGSGHGKEDARLQRAAGQRGEADEPAHLAEETAALSQRPRVP